MLSCKECNFSSLNIENGNYECRNQPPKIFMIPQQGSAGQMGLAAMSLFPVVQVNWWCGDFWDGKEGGKEAGKGE